MESRRNFHRASYSIVQSAIAHNLRMRGAASLGLASENPVMRATNMALQSLDENRPVASEALAVFPFSNCIHLMVEYAEALITRNKAKAQEVLNQAKMSSCDVGWFTAVVDYIDAYWLHWDKIPYVDSGGDPTKFVYSLPNQSSLKIGVLGDWATGEPVATLVLEQLVALAPDVIIHVGDIYYAGTHEECWHFFLDQMNAVRAKTGIPVYNLPGNHDMYSGGANFYQLLPLLNKAPFAPPNTPVQQASYFCLRNNWLQLQGMDTGYFDSDIFQVAKDITHLHPTEATWHQKQIEAAGARKVILFSHHQPFSAFLKIGGAAFNKYLQSDLGPLIGQKKVNAWFWGHEHILEVYKPNTYFPGLGYGACVGHSAFPVLVEEKPYTVVSPDVPFDPTYQLGTTDVVYNHGFTILELSQQIGSVTYYQMPGDGSSSKTSRFPSQILWSS
jgi:3',5'-cyclic AMP phosphodiesterase CpdA